MTPQPRIAHGLFTWQDGSVALGACLDSVAPFVDVILIADGLIDGVPANGLPRVSDWSGEIPAAPPVTLRSEERWPSLSACCNWLLCEARRQGCDWLLYIDGDQELHRGESLRAWCATNPNEIALPIVRVDLEASIRPCPWQLVSTSRVDRYVAGCFVVEVDGGTQLSLAPDGNRPASTRTGLPWISHHPERRPPYRQQHRLGQLETVLEPPPYVPCLQIAENVIQPDPMSADEVKGSTPEWFCDQCGERYHGPGVCANQHPPVELQHAPTVDGKASADAPDSAAGATDSGPTDSAAGAAETATGPGSDETPAPAPAEPANDPTPVDKARDLIRQAWDILSTL